MAPSIKDVAKLANVSTATVSHVINGTRFVAEETKQKVRLAMSQLNYQPSAIARSLRNQKTYSIGLLMPIMVQYSFDYYFMQMAHGAFNILREHGYNIILRSSNNNVKDEIEQIKIFNAEQIDGLIILPTGDEDGYLEEVLKDRYPVVFMDRRAPGYKTDCVLADNYTGSYEAVTQLVRKGHRRIACLSNDINVTTVNERLDGYRNAITDAGLELDEDLIQIGGYRFDEGSRMADHIIENTDVTAAFIADNLLLMGALSYLQKRHIKIPEQLAIIGFDDFEWERATTPPISVVKQPSYAIGEMAANVLLKKLKNPNREIKEYRLPTELIIRESF